MVMNHRDAGRVDWGMSMWHVTSRGWIRFRAGHLASLALGRFSHRYAWRTIQTVEYHRCVSSCWTPVVAELH